DRIIVGSDDQRAIAMLRSLYAPFQRNRERIIVMSVRSAELTKYAANAMLATRISFMNEVANLAEALGADIEEVRRGIGSDPRIGYQFLYAGVGAYDPAAGAEARKLFADSRSITIVEHALDALEGADALAILTEWQEFRSPDFAAIKQALKTPAIFDGRNLYDPAALRAQGL